MLELGSLPQRLRLPLPIGGFTVTGIQPKPIGKVNKLCLFTKGAGQREDEAFGASNLGSTTDK